MSILFSASPVQAQHINTSSCWPCKAQHLFILIQQSLEVVKWSVFSSSRGRLQFGRPTSIQTGWPFGGLANNNFSQIGWPFRLDIAKRFLSLNSIDWPFCTWHSHSNSLILVIDFGCTFAARWQWWFSLSLGQLWEKSVEPICFLFFEFGSIWQVRLNV